MVTKYARTPVNVYSYAGPTTSMPMTTGMRRVDCDPARPLHRAGPARLHRSRACGERLHDLLHNAHVVLNCRTHQCLVLWGLFERFRHASAQMPGGRCRFCSRPFPSSRTASAPLDAHRIDAHQGPACAAARQSLHVRSRLHRGKLRAEPACAAPLMQTLPAKLAAHDFACRHTSLQSRLPQ
jgi:hypothetical protein